MTKDEALLMALLALEMYVPYYIKDRGCKAIQACKEALEQPAQEPVWIPEYWTWTINHTYAGFSNHKPDEDEYDEDTLIPLYTHPAQDFFEKGKEIAKWADKQNEQPAQEPECSNHPDAPHGFCRDASHSAGRYVCECEGWEAEQQSQEPVAWGNPTYNYAVHHKVAPTWQGLKMTEVWEIVSKLESDDDDTYSEGLSIEDFYRAIEQALKEKNL